MSNRTEPTGRKRYRSVKRVFRKPLCVLQLEFRSAGTEYECYGGSRDYDYTFWRDATPEDVTTRDA